MESLIRMRILKFNMRFSKYNGCGNDFILIDDRRFKFPSQNQALIAHLCHRQFGIGADGIILLQSSTSADFKMRIFNSDGSEAEMCGNGTRCLAKFIIELGLPTKAYLIETMENEIMIEFVGDDVRVKMARPYDFKDGIPLVVVSKQLEAHYLNTGVPHSVVFVDDIETIDVDNVGRKLRYHEIFSPKGTNVNFVKIHSNDTLAIRTYERGVEQETLACGTGAVASAIAYAKINNLSHPINIQTRSGESLRVEFEHKDDRFENVFMIGPARFVYRGEFELNRSC